jgi:uncharacterized membrane protein
MTETTPQQSPSTVVLPAQQQQYVLIAPAPPTNVLAVLSLVGSIIGFHVVGVIMGHIALAQIKRTRESGRGLAIAGLVIGYVVLGFWIAALLLWVIGLIVTAVFGIAMYSIVPYTGGYGY